MKYTIIIILSLSALLSKAQIPDGTYKSSNDSYRTNYFLIVSGEEITLFGWETTFENDTIYFRSTAKRDSKKKITFKTFEFQQERLTEDNLKDFEPDNNLDIDSFLLHRYLSDIEESNGEINLKATKDVYDSRVDFFKFIKLINLTVKTLYDHEKL